MLKRLKNTSSFGDVYRTLSNIDIKKLDSDALLGIQAQIEQIIPELEITQALVISELIFKIQVQIIANSNSMYKLTEFTGNLLTFVMSKEISISSDQFAALIDAINQIHNNTKDLIIEDSLDNRGEDLQRLLSIMHMLWLDNEFFPAVEKMNLVKMKATTYQDSASKSNNVSDIVEQILERETIEEGTLFATCIAGQVRSKNFASKIYNIPEHSAKLINGYKSYGPIIQTLDNIKSQKIPGRENNMVVFTDQSGSDLLILIKGLTEYIIRKKIIGIDPIEIINVMQGDLKSLGIKNLIIAEKDIVPLSGEA